MTGAPVRCDLRPTGVSSSFSCWLMPPMIALAPCFCTALRSSAMTASASSPSGERNLPLTMSLARICWMMASYSGPSGRSSGTIGGA